MIATDPLRRFWRRSGLKRAWHDWRFRRRNAEWLALKRPIAQGAADGAALVPTRVLVVPPDPVGVTASLGDAAMLDVLLQQLKALPGPLEIVVGVDESSAAPAMPLPDVTRVPLFGPGWSLERTYRAARAVNAGSVFLIGADVLDGITNPSFSGTLLMLVDLLATAGAKVQVLGFSVAENCHPGLEGVFRALAARGALNARDPVTHGRLRSRYRVEARLVADCAFLLKPAFTPAVEHIGRWVDGHRAQGRPVLGLNVHTFPPHLDGPENQERLVSAVCGHARAMVERLGAAVVLLPHDFRTHAGDLLVLARVHERLKDGFADTVLLADRISTPHEAKAVASRMDGVVTGRMHLAIAAFGAGTPALLVGGSEKMDGLLQHFGHGAEMRIALGEFLDAQAGFARIAAFSRDLPACRAHVGRALPAVLELSRGNFSSIQPSSTPVRELAH